MPPPTTTITMIEPARRRSVELPNEVLYKIILFTLGHNGSVIHGQYYDILAKSALFEQLANFLCVSSKFRDLTMSVFYGLHKFKFPIDFEPRRSLVNKHGNTRNPLLPPIWALSSLRRITLEIAITDSRLELPHPTRRGFLNRDTHEPREVIWFRSIKNLYRYCPGARVLRLLTDHMKDLTVLDIHILENFRHKDKQEAIDLYRAAGFKIRADEVNVRITNLFTPDFPQKPWYPDLVNALNIEKRVIATNGGDCH
ncbi:hypothetical protein J3E72DRAFT_432589 [Bipolaris maydis]|nr:hypothetical protein BM1_07012 [Bipolaris maydis]KAJ5058313.1 hypothetical protein J3E74DRAFT_420034 [Bipolaris maydis]KAJ6195559.1 hypothetical protein J3E72DRAFT_432589 [Bipolaris maydis]KAJ6279858.1 hypothetical protein J3E71DRAFT_400945 [Bipolaris maydis]